ncbi:DNA topoisomerase [Ruminococcus sp. D40t1_170626_H2]|jgi:DNA topoisomerase IA|uniref:DNA topoisomerase n=1 Tax=Blautia faecis TaxID=871665 RepID=A0ABX2H6D9_9FIRM|nr:MULTISPECIES: DNA topoisomerase [Clostridia]MCQ4932601.1 DNA topoisomerase [Blautia faecis]MDB8755544.1 DNA topoisomerase [Ruminococcus sp. 1001136sp1]MDB8759637.1 DNA topoisomerase [Ruminococcus sp. 1001136sp1]MDB8763705.1 DNA topoisomerase [Ruminococcus sp. 1001136sp1]MDB8767394.1 DNA topoisomerase [Ruminococcus sp. 1001136sp1]
MKLVIAEKPSVAMALASVIGARTRKDGYVEGNGYLVSWCVGHLVGLCDASEYDEKYKKWRYEDLPIVPECWKHRVLEGTKKQFGILKKLMRDSKVDEVICATDAGREGELIFRLVYEQAGCKKPMKRLWISSMEEQAIKDGFASLKDGSCYDSLYQSALCRAKADWLVGINASRLFSVLYNQNLKVGRVQTPTLAMIVDRNQKIKEFTKEKYYMAHIKFDEMDAVTEHFQKKEDADRVAADCMERMCEVEKDDVKEKTVRPPKLYDLTTLQREANRMFGYTAQQTLDAVQEMYEQKLVTYPRTDSQYLTDEMGESTETLIQMLLGKMPYAEGLEYHPDVSKVLNSKKVSDHHAIIPTMEVAKADIGELKERNRKILYLMNPRCQKLSELDAKTAEMDKEWYAKRDPKTEEPTKIAKIYVTVYYAEKGEQMLHHFKKSMDIGNGHGGIVSQLKYDNEMKLTDEYWINYQKGKGSEEFQKYMEDLTDMQNHVLPYLQSFCNLEEKGVKERREQQIAERYEGRADERVTSTEANEVVKDVGKTDRKPAQQKQAVDGKDKKLSIHERLEINKRIIQEKQGKDKTERGVDLGVRTV